MSKGSDQSRKDFGMMSWLELDDVILFPDTIITHMVNVFLRDAANPCTKLEHWLLGIKHPGT